ncbi:uncharacterized protein LDX57_007323 [Aspergillus melleus]|uniref:uncharacterized protein n=1 Tax=Aspergillus melleus TaxID=138277 RepID=UPI001E8DDAA0|nr:uncharacterized protein LDX57_007323 [Aspergillus melleus]KAH8429651.1 hypothetical protein LDX57_007323 [Aspergillus melleus]
MNIPSNLSFTADEAQLLDDDFDRSPLSLILLANIPQLGLSTIYFFHNDIITNMVLAAEYADYSHERKPLRVSWPRGSQRSTYWLSLPYKYSLPMIVLSALMHWLLSQAMSYVHAIGYDKYGTVHKKISSVSFNGVPCLLCGVIGLVMSFVTLALGYRRLRGHMPIAGNCSAAISAACHSPEDDRDASLKGVMWGEVKNVNINPSIPSQSPGLVDELRSPDGTSDETSENNHESIALTSEFVPLPAYGHCCFTSYDAMAPSLDRQYC